MGAKKDSLNYQAIEMERLSELQRSITERLKNSNDIGYGDSLRHVVLSNIVANEYEAARGMLNTYVEQKREYPGFVDRASRFQQHCLDLISAIAAKRNFQGLGSLPLAKQQEIYERVVEHFEELTHFLKSIERLEKEARLDDIRATTWVIKATMNCVFVIFAVAFVMEMKNGMGHSFVRVFEALVADASNWVFRLIGW